MAESFWSSADLEPKRSHRWIMNIGGIPTYIIKTTGRPSYTVGKATHDYLNHQFHYPGKVKYEPIKVTLVDPVTPDATLTVQGILIRSGYNFPDEFVNGVAPQNNYSTISKADAVAALGRVTISMLGPGGHNLEETELVNGWLSKIDFSELDYSKDDLLNLNMEITFDFARIISSGPGVAV